MIQLGSKKLTKKVKAVIKSDVIGSVVLVSVLINVFFFTGVVLFSATNQLDASLYNAAVTNLCSSNYADNLSVELDEAKNPDAAKAKFEIMCRSGEFSRYYENAVEAYLDSNQR